MSKNFSLCYVTDRLALAPEPLSGRIGAAVAAGVELIQLREKDLPTQELLALATASVQRARGSGSRIIVNDRLDVALAAGAAGVHLGRHSMPAERVRPEVPGNFLVGVSCHSPEEAAAADAAGADYILLGPVFETPSKARYGPPLGLAKLAEAARSVQAPVLALGGITVERAGVCLENGAAGVAGIRLFQDCASLADRAGELRKILESRGEPAGG